MMKIDLNSLKNVMQDKKSDLTSTVMMCLCGSCGCACNCSCSCLCGGSCKCFENSSLIENLDTIYS